jgi:hypothetical protein
MGADTDWFPEDCWLAVNSIGGDDLDGDTKTGKGGISDTRQDARVIDAFARNWRGRACVANGIIRREPHVFAASAASCSSIRNVSAAPSRAYPPSRKGLWSPYNPSTGEPTYSSHFSYTVQTAAMAVDDSVKRKAEDEPMDGASPAKRLKSQSISTPAGSAQSPMPPHLEPVAYPEKPAVIEERQREIEFRVVNNDNHRDSTIILTGLKCIFQKQLPKMPKDYIARLVYDRTHLSLAIVKNPGMEVLG